MKHYIGTLLSKCKSVSEVWGVIAVQDRGVLLCVNVCIMKGLYESGI